MADHKFSANDWINAYKEYALENGELVASMKHLIQYKGKPYIEFRTHFEDLEALETMIIKNYFQSALHQLSEDENKHNLSGKEQQLAFLYLLIEAVEDDEIFLELILKAKSKNVAFMLNIQKSLKTLELEWSKLKGWRPDFIDKYDINPKQTIFVNHALSCIWFYLKDKSEDKQDTDAYIEKTTDLMFKVTDTSTLQSMLDFGKFMYSRKDSTFG